MENNDNELKEKIRQEIIEDGNYEPTEAEVELYTNFAKVNEEEEIKKRNKPVNPIKMINSWLITGWAFLSIGLIIFFITKEQMPSFYISFGQLFVILLLINLIEDKIYEIVAPIFGYIILFVAFRFDFFFKDFSSFNQDVIPPFLIGSVFLGFGILRIIAYMSFKKNFNKNFTTLFGKVSGYDEHKDGTVACLYKYEYNGKEYNTLLPNYTKEKTKRIEELTELYVNNQNPHDILNKETLPKLILSDLIFIFIGIVLIFFGIISL